MERNSNRGEEPQQSRQPDRKEGLPRPADKPSLARQDRLGDFQTRQESSLTGQEQPAGPPATPEQPATATPEHTVFDRVAELEARVAELEAREARRREQQRDRYLRWRDKDPEQARKQTRERVRAYRARKRGTAGHQDGQ